MKAYKKTLYEYRLLRESKAEFKCVKITSSRDIEEFIRPLFDNLEIYESMYAVYLNSQNNVIALIKISQGGINATLADIRLIAKYGIELLATSLILIHNHPSGVLKPSEADISITKKVKDGLKLLDINVLDHLILTEDAFYSFADNSRI